jgi:ribosome assembly protein YihI (activator of Der GTPase)
MTEDEFNHIVKIVSEQCLVIKTHAEKLLNALENKEEFQKEKLIEDLFEVDYQLSRIESLMSEIDE